MIARVKSTGELVNVLPFTRFSSNAVGVEIAYAEDSNNTSARTFREDELEFSNFQVGDKPKNDNPEDLVFWRQFTAETAKELLLRDVDMDTAVKLAITLAGKLKEFGI